MIPWSHSSWSLTDLIRSVGVKRSQFAGWTCDDAREWLYARGYMERAPGCLTWRESGLVEERAA